jgi:glycosyltransferase involved in cell wall biosynthesis
MPVRPGEGDSIEQLVSALAEGLAARGHEVTLYATEDSVTSADLRSLYARGYDEDDELWDWQLRESLHAAHALERAGDHDVVHAHDYHFAVPFSGLVSTALVTTHHTELSPELVEAYARRPELQVVAVSAYQRECLGDRVNAAVIHHGIDAGAFPFDAGAGEYLLFLGRMIADKGPGEAIRIARAAERPLVLAGPAEEGYDVTLEPGFDADGVQYAGRVDAGERNRLLAGAAALLFPVAYPEPFGLVLLEAMACGTPVLATALGAVPEIVDEAVTGYTAPSWQDLAALVPAAAALDRPTIRRVAERRWDVGRMVDEHEALYRRLVAGVSA